MTQAARNLVMDPDDAGRSFWSLIRDRDTKFTATCDTVLADSGITILKTPPQAPQANAFAERQVGTVRRECTDRLLITRRRHPSAVLDRYLDHYNRHRPHQPLEQRPPNPRCKPMAGNTATVLRRQVLDGLINEYDRAA